MKKIDYTKLKGQDLYSYFTKDHDDKDYGSIVELLPISTGSFDETYMILERAVAEDKKLNVCYPELNEDIPDDAEIIGEVPDGILYLM